MTNLEHADEDSYFESDGLCPNILCYRKRKKQFNWRFWMRTIIFAIVGFLSLFSLYGEDKTHEALDLDERFLYLYTLIYHIDQNQSNPQYVSYLCELAHNKIFEIEWILNNKEKASGIN